MNEEKTAVDPEVARAFEALKALPAVKEALRLVREKLPETTEIQKELALIEAPSRHEEKKAARYAELLSEAGLEEVETDPHGNVFGFVQGAGRTGSSVLLEGHLDTVFSFGDVKGLIVDSLGRIHCPGICDDTRALAANLAVLKAFRACGIHPHHDLVFAGTVCEEGLGAMDGMKWLLDEDLPPRTKLLASISIDGGSRGTFYANATGMVDWQVDYEGPGGHVWTAWGEPSAVHAAARSAAKLADLRLPEDPKTVLSVTLIEGGQAIHGIAQRATFKVNARSNSSEVLERLNRRMQELFQAGADEENARWGTPGRIRMSCRKILDIPAGSQPESSRIVQAARAASFAAGVQPRLLPGGCTNGNIAIARGIPAVTLSRGGEEFGTHTLAEWFDPRGVWVCEQRSLLLLLALAGVEGELAPLDLRV